MSGTDPRELVRKQAILRPQQAGGAAQNEPLADALRLLVAPASTRVAGWQRASIGLPASGCG